MSDTLTPKRALQATLKIWQELADTGDYRKPDEASNRYKHGCPCCEFVCQQIPTERDDGMSCSVMSWQRDYTATQPNEVEALSLCPLKSLWPSGCCASGSLFEIWESSLTAKLRQACARKIVKGCERALKKLETKEKTD